MKKIVTIKWEDTLKSMKLAERNKTRLENLGYNLISSKACFFGGESVYKKGN